MPRAFARLESDCLVALQLCRARDLAAFLPRAVLLVAFLPPIARLLSRRPRVPTCDLPSRSCWYVSPRASLRSVLTRFRLFFRLLSYLEAPASFNAMATAWRRLLTLPPLP